MSYPRLRVCANCTEAGAVVGSELCDHCEDAFDLNAHDSGMTRNEYAKAMGVKVLPRKGMNE
jgi:hypothetical protein